MAKTYYEILGVAENATAEEIEAAFRKRAIEVHPDTVAPGNAYLRQVAAEAFKDLSEAKAVLLDSIERQKYDAKLIYLRGSGQARTETTEAPPASQTGPRSRTAPQSETAHRAQRARPAPAPKRKPRYVLQQPLRASLVSFLFLILGLGAIFFIGWLMTSGRTPPWWLVVITLSLGLLSVRQGLRPSTNTRVREASVPLLACGFVLAAVLFSVWLPSPRFIVTHTTAGRAAPTAADAATRKAPGRSSVREPMIATVDGSGVADVPVRIWKNLGDGQDYRTRLDDDNTLSLESIAGNPGGVAGITKCELHRASSEQNWSGVCWERNPKDQGTRQSSATVSTFSDTRMEGSTSDIPQFTMIPVETAAMGATTPPHLTAEPDLSSLSRPEKLSLESACASDKLMEGPAEYNRCVEKQLVALKALPKRPDLSGLSSAERDLAEAQCATAKLMQGPAAYYQCLSNQLDLRKKQRR